MVILVWPRTLALHLFFTFVLDTTPETVRVLVAKIREYEVKSILSLDKENQVNVKGLFNLKKKMIKPVDAEIA